MKKLISLVLAVLILVSCTTENPQSDPETHQSAVSVSESGVPQEQVRFDGFSGMLPVTLPYLASLDGFAASGQLDRGTYNSYPLIYTDGTDVYICRNGNCIAGYTDPAADPVSAVTLEGIENGITTLAFAVHGDEILLVTNRTSDNTASRFDREGNLIESVPFPVHKWFRDFMPAFVGDDLYYLEQEGVDENTPVYSPSSPAERTLYRKNPWTGESSTIGENVRAYCVSDGAVYFVQSRVNDRFETEYTLFRYDPEDGSIAEEAALNLHPSAVRNLSSVIAYDSVNRILYYQLSGAVFAHLLGTDENRQISRCSNEFWISGGIFSMDGRNGTLELYRTSADPMDFSDLMPVLRISSLAPDGMFNPLAYDDALAVLEEQDLYLALEGTYTADLRNPDEYAYTMAKKLMAGDSDFDIFMVTTEMSNLMQERYYENLAGYDVLNTYYAEMIPGLTGICTVDSTLALIPSKLSYDMMIADDSLTGSVFPLPETLTGFPEFAAEIAPALGDGSYFMIPPNRFIFYVPWFRQFASHYILGDPDEDEARRDLTELYRLIDEINSHPSVNPDAWNTGKPYLRLNISLMKRSKKLSKNSRIAPVPPIKEGYLPTVSGEFWAINPASPNKESAAQFLAALMESEKNSFDTIFFNVNPEESAALFDVIKEITQNSLRAYDIPDLVSRLAEQFAEIESGTLTPDEAAEEMWHYLHMIKYE